ncbi:MAG: hypothetical protein HYY93_04685 [Planctomycetes bacterium]|nr:hypothetical protein [Planctomycetota bacterium]
MRRSLPALFALALLPPVCFGQTPVTEAECQALGVEIQESIDASDPSVLNGAVDLDALLERAMAGVEAPAKERSDFKAGLTSTFDFGKAICDTLQGNPGYSFLRTRKVDGTTRLLYRLITPEGGLNYHEHILTRSPEGKVRIIDTYIYLTAETLSQTFRRSWLPVAAEANRGAIDKLLGSESEYIKHVDEIVRMSELKQKGEDRAAMEVYAKLPASLKPEKSVQIIRLSCAMRIGGKDYEGAIEDFRKFHPKDPALDLILIDGHVMAGKHAEAVADIDRLDRNVGGDPYLDVLRASIWMEGKDLDKARDSAKRATEKDPESLQAWLVRLSIALSRKDHADTASFLSKIEEDFGIEWKDLTEVPEYADFVKSPEYEKWMEGRKGE